MIILDEKFMRLLSFFLLLSLMGTPFWLLAQQKPAYQLFNSKGKRLTYKRSLRQLREAEVVFLGELHNNPISHWLQLELTRDLLANRGASNLVLGAEMFERDQQPALDHFLDTEQPPREFEAGTELWPNYDTDYRPLVELAKAEGIPFVATNIPRRFARQVSRQGVAALDSLPEAEKAWVAPLPFEIDYELPAYQRMREMMGGHGHGMAVDNFVAAQASKDATMAYFIRQHRQPGQLFIHLNGAYHSDFKEGIVWYLWQAEPSLEIVTFTTVEQDQIDELDPEHLGRADVIIAVPSSMTKTYRGMGE
jgi:uncharacterized iron-regulated protein